MTKTCKYHVGVIALVWLTIAGAHAFSFLLVDRQFFCTTAWECSTWAPYFSWNRSQFGDLGRMAGPPQLKIKKPQVFTLDEYGFRNPVGQFDKGIDFVLIGQSFGGGSQLSDDEHFIRRIEKKTGLNGYNYSIRLLREYVADERFIEKPPKLLIVFTVEGYFRQSVWDFDANVPRHRSTKGTPPGPAPRRTIAETFQAMSAQLDQPSIASKYAEDFYKGLLFQLGLFPFSNEIGFYDKATGMLFYSEFCQEIPNQVWPRVDQTVENLAQFKELLASRGTQMLTIVLPRKEEFYKRMNPAQRDLPEYVQLEHIYAKLAERGIEAIRAHDILKDYERTHPGEWLYFLDDTHMNPLGHEILATAAYERISRLTQNTLSQRGH